MQPPLEGKVAVVTASTKGIGLGVARALASADASVAICSRSQAAVDKVASELHTAGSGSVLGITVDLASKTDLETLVDAVHDRLGGVDILVNNNGGPPTGAALSFGDSEWRAALDTNLLSTIRLTQMLAPDMKAKGWGRVVNLTSTTAKEPESGMVLSNVTRAAVAAYGKTMARELGPFGVTVNTILTGGVLTDRLRSLIAAEVGPAEDAIDAAIRDAATSIPVGYIASPEEFAQTVLYLVSEDAAYLNGAAIPLDGGASLSIF